MKTIVRIFVVALTASVLAKASAQQLFIYDNINTAQTGVFYNGGSENQSSNIITRLVADDLTPIGGYAGIMIDRIYFSVINNNATAVSARPRLRIWDDNGADGGPGTLITGFSFNPISFAANSGSSFFFNPGGLTVPSGTFWIGMTFDNNTGGTGATLAQMDNLGMALFNPPTVGTSADTFFLTTAAGSHLVNNPVGTLGNFGGNPPANFFFGITVVPEPGTLALAGVGISMLVIFRRRK